MDAPPLPVIETPRRRRRPIRLLLWALLIAASVAGFVLVMRWMPQRAFYATSRSMLPTLKPGDRFIADRWGYADREPKRGDIVVYNMPPEETDGGEKDLQSVSRIVALPGETVEVRPPSLKIEDETYDPILYGQALHDYLRSRLNISEESAVKIAKDGLRVDGKRFVPLKEIAQALGAANVTLTPGRVYIDGKPLDEPYTNEDPGYRFPLLRLGEDRFFLLGDNRNRARDSHMWNALKRDRIVGPVTVIWK